MKLSVQSANIINTDLSNLDEALSLIKESGFSAIDFNFTEYSHDDIKKAKRCPFFEKSTEILIAHYNGLLKACEKYGVEVGQTHAPYPTFVFGADKKFNDYSHAYINWGQVFKAPTMDDLYYYSDMGSWGLYEGNPNLKPETGDSWTIGYSSRINDKLFI